VLSPVVIELPARVAVIEQDDFAVTLGAAAWGAWNPTSGIVAAERSVADIHEPVDPRQRGHRRG
jgi:hypothetical protein